MKLLKLRYFVQILGGEGGLYKRTALPQLKLAVMYLVILLTFLTTHCIVSLIRYVKHTLLIFKF